MTCIVFANVVSCFQHALIGLSHFLPVLHEWKICMRICFLSHVPHISQGGTAMCVAFYTQCEPFDAVSHSLCAALDWSLCSATQCARNQQVGRWDLSWIVTLTSAPARPSVNTMVHYFVFVPDMQPVMGSNANLHTTHFHTYRGCSSVGEVVGNIWSLGPCLSHDVCQFDGEFLALVLGWPLCEQQPCVKHS